MCSIYCCVLILGIETSCDETAVAIVNAQGVILSNIIASQISTHEKFGGVVPEIAARAHLERLDSLILQALAEAKCEFSDLSGVAATCGPGLVGGLIVGMMAGKAIALAHDLPFFGINHLEAHALSARLNADIAFPYLFLLISGGHSQILVAEDIGHYHLWGTTRDDAAGECFDKSARLMGLPYCGGAALEQEASKCSDPAQALARFPLPIPMQGQDHCDFSFSGLKTAMRTHIEREQKKEQEEKRQDTPPSLSNQTISDLAYALQHSISATLEDRCARAMRRFHQTYPDLFLDRQDDNRQDNNKKNNTNENAPASLTSPAFVVCGGVGANQAIRRALENLCQKNGFAFHAPPIPLCGDNGAMVAWAGLEWMRKGITTPLNIPARPRWALDTLAFCVQKE